MPEARVRFVPKLVCADPFRRARREFVDDLGEAEVCVDLLQQGVNAVTSGWICSSVQNMWPSSWVKARMRMMPCRSARGFVARAHAELAIAQRQLAIAVQTLAVRSARGPGSSSA